MMVKPKNWFSSWQGLHAKSQNLGVSSGWAVHFLSLRFSFPETGPINLLYVVLLKDSVLKAVCKLCKVIRDIECENQSFMSRMC